MRAYELTKADICPELILRGIVFFLEKSLTKIIFPVHAIHMKLIM